MLHPVSAVYEEDPLLSLIVGLATAGAYDPGI